MIKLLKFSSASCIPCKMMTNIVDVFKKRNPEVVVEEYDVNEDGDLGYDITSVPTIIIIRDGEIVNRFVGITALNILESNLKAHE